MATDNLLQMTWFGADPALPDSAAALAYAQQAQAQHGKLFRPLAKPPESLTNQMMNEIRQLQNEISNLCASQAFDRRHIGVLLDQQAAIIRQRDSFEQAGVELVAELLALKAKYEPAPEPAPNPWGKMFVGGVGSAIER